jgi:hypothetical protein
LETEVPTDEKQLAALQDEYLSTRSDRALSALYQASLAVVVKIVKGILKRKGVVYDPLKEEAVCHDATMLLIGRYLEDPTFRVTRSFTYILRCKAREVLFAYRTQKQERNETSMGTAGESKADPSRFEDQVVDKMHTLSLLNHVIPRVIDDSIRSRMVTARKEVLPYLKACIEGTAQYRDVIRMFRKDQVIERSLFIHAMEEVRAYLRKGGEDESESL